MLLEEKYAFDLGKPSISGDISFQNNDKISRQHTALLII